jgi:hypothetical protein
LGTGPYVNCCWKWVKWKNAEIPILGNKQNFVKVGKYSGLTNCRKDCKEQKRNIHCIYYRLAVLGKNYSCLLSELKFIHIPL